MGKYVHNLYNYDHDAFSAFRICGYVTAEQLKKNCDISPTRLKHYKLDGLISKESYMVKGQSKNSIAYRITPLGEAVAQKKFGLNNFYHAKNPNHDLEIANRYFSLSQSEQQSARSETEVRKDIEARIEEMKEHDREQSETYEKMLVEGLISTPDMVYTMAETNIEIAYEVVTSNYTTADIQAKAVACEIIKAELETSKA